MVFALCLHIWQSNATEWFGTAPEGVVANTYALTQVLGFPLNVVLSASVNVRGLVEYYLLLLGIVVNWAMIGLLRGVNKRRSA